MELIDLGLDIHGFVLTLVDLAWRTSLFYLCAWLAFRVVEWFGETLLRVVR